VNTNDVPIDKVSIRPDAQVGDWTLLKRDEENPRRWLCRCKCGREQSVDRSNLTSGRSTSCNTGPCRKASRVATAERFWSHVDKSNLVGCWPWTGAVGKRGYGVLSWNGYTYSAHRIAAWLAGIIEDPYEERGLFGILVGHECDTKLCCRPDHLRKTTSAQNTKETWERIRSGRTK